MIQITTRIVTVFYLFRFEDGFTVHSIDDNTEIHTSK